MKKLLTLGIAAAGVAALSACGPAPVYQQTAVASTFVCSDAAGNRVPDNFCGGGYVGYHPIYFNAGAIIPAYGVHIVGGYARPLVGVTYSRPSVAVRSVARPSSSYWGSSRSAAPSSYRGSSYSGSSYSRPSSFGGSSYRSSSFSSGSSYRSSSSSFGGSRRR